MALYDQSKFYIDFSSRPNISDDDKKKLEDIQNNYRPIERSELLNEFRVNGTITSDEYETMTGLPYDFN
jgi:hypothetical protein